MRYLYEMGNIEVSIFPPASTRGKIRKVQDL